jgi:hypothetical protein
MLIKVRFIKREIKIKFNSCIFKENLKTYLSNTVVNSVSLKL